MGAAQNGRLPDSALAPIPGGGRLLAAVAVTWLAIIAEVETLHGWTPRPTGPLDAYRPYGGSYYAQVETFLRRYSRTRIAGRPTKTWNGVTYWLRPGQAAAATPGTSNHGWACAVDVTGLGGFAGLRYRQFSAVASRYGWTNTEGRRIGEPWHWVDVGNAHLVANGLTTIGVVADVPTITAPDPITGGDMSLTQDQSDALNEIRGNSQAALNGIKGLISAIGTVDSGPLHTLRAGMDLSRAEHTNILNAVLGVANAVRGIRPGDVDEAALATALAPLLSSPALSTTDLARVAQAVADEQARRMTS